MKPVALRLKWEGVARGESARRSIAGWFVPGSSAGEWLEEIAGWDCDQRRLQLLPLRAVESDGGRHEEMLGVVVVGAGEVNASHGCRGYGFVGAQVLVPVEGEIVPPVGDAEWGEILPSREALFVWHPVVGLMRFDPEDVLRVRDLVRGAEERTADWSAARTGVAFAERLLSVSSAEPAVTLAEMESIWREELGMSLGWKELPKAPGELGLSAAERVMGGLGAGWEFLKRGWGKLFGGKKDRAESGPRGKEGLVEARKGGLGWLVAVVVVTLFGVLLWAVMSGEGGSWEFDLGRVLGMMLSGLIVGMGGWLLLSLLMRSGAGGFEERPAERFLRENRGEGWGGLGVVAVTGGLLLVAAVVVWGLSTLTPAQLGGLIGFVLGLGFVIGVCWLMWRGISKLLQRSWQDFMDMHVGYPFMLLMVLSGATGWLRAAVPNWMKNPNPVEIIVTLLVILGAVATVIWLAFRDTGRGQRGAKPGQPAAPPATSSAKTGGTAGTGWGAFFKGVLTSPGKMLREIDERKRTREVQRLLHMLQSDPEKGLRYAIPMMGDVGRGLGRAGNQLMAWNLFAFSFFGGGGGGGAVDPWRIDPAQQLQLTQRYRELAEREVRAGRYRKGASLYARLLGDWTAAANALKEGKLYGEAAAIYLERLKNNVEAAKCYELAGQHETALKLYMKLEMWVAVGDLCQRMRRNEEATIHYRAAVEQAVKRKDIKGAVEVLETKLRDVDGALALLERSWNDTAAEVHFDQWLEVAARHQLHERAGAWIRKLSFWTDQREALKLLPRLRKVMQTYPQQEVQGIAREQTLRMVAEHLQKGSPSVTRQLALALAPLEPADRLLPRDCDRFVSRWHGVAAKEERRFDRGKLQLLSRGMTYAGAYRRPVLGCSQGWIALTEASQLVLTARDGSFAKLLLEGTRLDNPARLIAVDEARREVWLGGSGVSMPFQWPGNGGERWTALFPTWLPQECLAATVDREGIAATLWVDPQEQTWVSVFPVKNPAAVTSVRLGRERTSVGEETFLRCAIWMLGADQIMTYRPVGEGSPLIEMHDLLGTKIQSDVIWGERIVPRDDGTNSVLVFDPERVWLLSKPLELEDPKSPDPLVESYGWSDPQGCFLHGELFAVADGHRVGVFSFQESKPVFEVEYGGAAVLGVRELGLGMFSVFRADGCVELWRYA